MTATNLAPVRPADVDLGVCRGKAFDIGANRWVILLPGAGYTVTAPLLWFAREAALAGGCNVLAVSDTFSGTDDPLRWVEERAEAAIQQVDGPGPPLLIAKSLTSLAAPLAARLGLSAVWLTPLINASGTSESQLVTDGLAAASAPYLLVGGTADPTWDAVIARSVPKAEVLEIGEADHLLQIPGDVAGSVDALDRVVSAVATFIAGPKATEDQPAMRLTGMDHIQLAIPPNGEATARAFYGGLLGLREVAKPDALASRGGCWFVGLGIHLHLGVADDFQPAHKAHPAFSVANLAALRHRLTEAGVPVIEDESVPDVRPACTVTGGGVSRPGPTLPASATGSSRRGSNGSRGPHATSPTRRAPRRLRASRRRECSTAMDLRRARAGGGFLDHRLGEIVGTFGWPSGV